MSSILLSPYLGAGESEYHGLAQLDAWFRERNALHIGLLISCIKAGKAKTGDDVSHFTAFAKKVGAWIDHLKEARKKILPSRWAEEFNDLLSGLGWAAGGPALDSGEYQALKAWHEILSGFAGLDDISGPMDRSDAVNRIIRMAQDMTHQPEAPECAIQILGTLEATAGHYFDHIWLLGCHDDAFPPQPSPNPFIPLFVQREHNVPHSSPDREHAFARVVLKRMLQCAPHIEVSWPEVIDEKETRLSPLIRNLQGRDGDSFIEDGSRMKDTVHSRYELEEMPADWHLPLAAGEK